MAGTVVVNVPGVVKFWTMTVGMAYTIGLEKLLTFVGWATAFVFAVAFMMEILEAVGYTVLAYRCMCIPW
jgi:hypothetical protein